MVAAAVFTQRPTNEYSASRGLYAPDLGDRADTVREIVIRTAQDTLRLARGDGGWVAENKTGYPADAARVRELVVGLSRLQRLDKKTADPQRLARLELTDVREPGSKAVAVTLLAGDGETLADVLVGKTQDFQSADYSRYFVRNAGDPQSWLVQGTLPPVLEDTGNWLERKLLPGVAGTGFQSIEVTHPGGESVEVLRESAEQEDYEVAGLSGEETVDSQYSVNQIADTLNRLSLKDVRQADAAGEEQAVLQVAALTFNGVRISARFDRRDPDYGVRLSASYAPELDRSEAEVEEDDGAGGEQDERAENAGTVGGEQLARDLSRRWQDRLFIVSQYALDALMVKRSDLIKPVQPAGE
jgi:hypothetical protein